MSDDFDKGYDKGFVLGADEAVRESMNEVAEDFKVADARILELEAENARLTKERDEARAAQAAMVTRMEALEGLATEGLRVLKLHHAWHQQEGAELVLGDETLDIASCYVDSSMEEQTTDAIIGLRNALTPASGKQEGADDGGN